MIGAEQGKITIKMNSTAQNYHDQPNNMYIKSMSMNNKK
jgi:hypothetical protein